MAVTSILQENSELSIHKRIQFDRDISSVEQGFVWKDIVKYREYSRGKHAISLTDKQKEILRNLLGHEFCDNVCRDILSQTVGRITFSKYECANASVKEWLDQFYALCRILERQGDVHQRTMRDGNTVLGVRWNDKKKRVELTKQNWWNGSNGIYIHYSDVDEVDYAVKEWVESPDGIQKIYRRLVWYPDRLERYMATTPSPEAWKMVNLSKDPTDADGGPIGAVPWRDNEGNPLGVPYVHFFNANKQEENYGESELAGGVLGFQDQINDMHYGISQTSRLTGGQMYYATGVKLKKKDGTTELVPPKTEPGAWHTSENADSTFGALPAGDIDKQIKALELKLKRVASMTQTPMHFITGGDWPAAEALLRAEQPALNKARRQINGLRSSWVDVAITALKIHNKYASEKVSFDVKSGIIDATFEDPENRDIVSRSIVVHNVGPYVSKRESLRIMGYSEEKAQDIYDETIEEGRDSAEAVADSIARGNIPTKNATGDRTDSDKA